ncbi:MAG TPA: hypothetical protein VHK91_09090 [Flavisolibacter sp.]|jgi:hypothetical protein|nr:hypothetical protein [Flavisolibacter sp.]
MRYLFGLWWLIAAPSLYGQALSADNLQHMKANEVVFDKEKFNLTDEQVARLDTILQQYYNGRLPVKEDSVVAQRAGRMKDLEERKQQQLKELFTPEQWKQYRKWAEDQLVIMETKKKEVKDKKDKEKHH